MLSSTIRKPLTAVIAVAAFATVAVPATSAHAAPNNGAFAKQQVAKGKLQTKCDSLQTQFNNNSDHANKFEAKGDMDAAHVYDDAAYENLDEAGRLGCTWAM